MQNNFMIINDDYAQTMIIIREILSFKGNADS